VELLGKFLEKWEPRPSTSVGTKVKEALRPPPPLKPRLEAAIRSLQSQINKLDMAHAKLVERDRQLFAKIVEAYTRHDMDHANVYANELAEIRKMAKMLMQSRLALEQIVVRLSTVKDLGDIVVTLAPALGVVRDVKQGITTVLPEAERELGEIGSLLSGILVDAGQMGGLTINFGAASEDAQKILAEAAAVAEQRMKEKLPVLPASLPSIEGRSEL